MMKNVSLSVFAMLITACGVGGSSTSITAGEGIEVAETDDAMTISLAAAYRQEVVAGAGIVVRTDGARRTVEIDADAQTSAIAASMAAHESRIVELERVVGEMSALLELQRTPSGTVIAHAGPLVPEGWMPCDGRGLVAEEHPALFDALGTTWGDGTDNCQGICDFNLPDLRGRFLRGVTDVGTLSRDPDAASRTASSTGGAVGARIGSVQADEIAAHFHGTAVNFPSNDPSRGVFDTGSYGTVDNALVESFVAQREAQNSSATGGSESRPKNAYVQYLIKR